MSTPPFALSLTWADLDELIADLGDIPFRTVALEWDVPGDQAPLDEVARRIAAELQNLIELLRGEHAE